MTYSDKAAEFEVAPSAAANFAKEVTMRIFTPKSAAGLAVGISPDLSASQDFSRLLSADIASATDLLDLTSFNLLRLASYGEGDRKEITFVSAIFENARKNGENLTVKTSSGTSKTRRLAPSARSLSQRWCRTGRERI
jgi:hypothetical protein